MITKIVTLNVNGMRSREKRSQILETFKFLNANIIMLQETHAVSTDEWLKGWKGPSFWAPGTPNARGCALLVDPGHEILKTLEDPEGRYIFAKLRKGLSGVFSVVCIYAPDSPGERAVFLESLLNKLSEFCGQDPVIMAGDFNFVENTKRDRLGSNQDLAQFTRGNFEFNQIAGHFNLKDVHLMLNIETPSYTWSNTKGDVQSRLDRIYISDCVPWTVVSLKTLNVSFSDHKILEMGLKFEARTKRGKGYWKLNTAVLGDLSFRSAVHSALATERHHKNGDLGVWWDNLKTAFKKDAIRVSKERAVWITKLQEKAENEICTLLNQKPTNLHELADATERLCNLRLEKARGAQARSGIQLAESNEVPNSYFYAVEKSKAAEKAIGELNIGGESVTDPDKIRSEIFDFYQKLYTPDTVTSQKDRNFFLGYISNKFPQEKKCTLTCPITPFEVSEVIEKTKKGKSPGIDGLPYEFYKEFREEISGHLADVFNQILAKGILSESQRTAVISLIPKKGDNTKLTNWRPISLQCCDAKILSKILANRLKTVMSDIVSESQVCSVPGRQIQDHLLLIRETIAMANHKRRPLYIISFDQEKAFDRVDWDFMLSVLAKFGIPSKFVEYGKTLYNMPTSFVCVNGFFTDLIDVKRGVRQGCPLSMLLYTLVAETIGNAIDADSNIRGAQTPGGKGEHKKVQFADDTNGIVRDTPSIYALFDLFQRYEAGTGARLCIHKTRGISINHKGDDPCRDIPILWNKSDTKILGVIFTADLNMAAKLNWDRITKAVASKSKAMSKRVLSLRAKALLANTLVLSKTWHVGRIFMPT